MPAIAGTAAVRHNDTASTSYTGDYPSGITSTDLLFAQILIRSSAAVTMTTVPSGWNLILNNSNALQLFTYWKAAAGSETGSVAWVASASSFTSSVAIVRISDADRVSPISGTAQGGTGSITQTITFPAVSPTVANTLLICCAGDSSVTSVSGYSGSLTERWDASGSTRHLCGASEPLAASGSSGTRTATAVDQIAYASQSIAIAPDASSVSDLVGMVGI